MIVLMEMQAEDFCPNNLACFYCFGTCELDGQYIGKDKEFDFQQHWQALNIQRSIWIKQVIILNLRDQRSVLWILFQFSGSDFDFCVYPFHLSELITI